MATLVVPAALLNSRNGAEVTYSAARPADVRTRSLNEPRIKRKRPCRRTSHCPTAEQGIKSIKDSPKRAEAFKAAAKQFGCMVKEIVWTQGAYDVISIIETPDEITASALALSVGKLGNITGQTLRAFSAAEFAKIVESRLSPNERAADSPGRPVVMPKRAKWSARPAASRQRVNGTAWR
jgi:uncharacterized protein with GYD domain